MSWYNSFSNSNLCWIKLDIFGFLCSTAPMKNPSLALYPEGKLCGFAHVSRNVNRFRCWFGAVCTHMNMLVSGSHISLLLMIYSNWGSLIILCFCCSRFSFFFDFVTWLSVRFWFLVIFMTFLMPSLKGILRLACFILSWRVSWVVWFVRGLFVDVTDSSPSQTYEPQYSWSVNSTDKTHPPTIAYCILSLFSYWNWIHDYLVKYQHLLAHSAVS